MLFDRSSPPPFYQAQLSSEQRMLLDQCFVGKRSQAHYLKRFGSFDRAQKIGFRWHWAAFFMTLPWLLYRKRFLDGLVYAVAGWSFLHLMTTLSLVAVETVIIPLIDETYRWPLRLSIVGVFWLGWAILTAGWADAYYYRVARREIAESIEEKLTPTEQTQRLEREGGVSLVGASLAMALFLGLLTIIQTVYLPLYATYKTRNLWLSVYDLTSNAQERVATMMAQTGTCPIGLPLSTEDDMQHLARLDILTHSNDTPASSRCIVQASIHGAPWPVKNLNGQRLSLYLDTEQHWHCVATTSHQEAPQSCQFE